ncbi:DUF1674 domain-containing protein [Mesorhizobium sp. CN2-181]
MSDKPATVEGTDSGGDEAPAPALGGAAKPMAPAARRALEEAAARRAETEARVAAMPREFGGRGGQEPIRYGDWEIKGIASDF